MLALESERSIEAIALRDAQPDERRPRRKSRPWSSLADDIIAFGTRPRWSWGFPHLDRIAPVPTGSLAYLIGPTGRGKSAFALQAARRHAEAAGPAVVFSAELAGALAGARTVSQVTTSSWFEVLTGGVEESVLRAALDVPRLRIVDDVAATWAEDIEAEIRASQDECPGQLVLIVVDYLQILRGAGADVRERVTTASATMREIAKRTGAVILCLAKPSRVAAKGLRSGELMGVDATESGAETNGIEQDAFAQIQLGAMRPQDPSRPSGPHVVEVSVSKARFGQPDTVIPFIFDGAHGWFQEDGEPATVAEHRERERGQVHAEKRSHREDNAKARVLAVLAAAEGPLSRNQITTSTRGRRTTSLSALDHLVAAGVVVEVVGRKAGGSAPLALASRVAELGLRHVERAQA